LIPASIPSRWRWSASALAAKTASVISRTVMDAVALRSTSSAVRETGCAAPKLRISPLPPVGGCGRDVVRRIKSLDDGLDGDHLGRETFDLRLAGLSANVSMEVDQARDGRMIGRGFEGVRHGRS
jgi:hypothetical protein